MFRLLSKEIDTPCTRCTNPSTPTVPNANPLSLHPHRYCSEEHPAPVQEPALRCLVSLTYVDRVVTPLVEAGCILKFVASLSTSVPATVRRSAALALLNVVVRDHYKAEVVKAGGVEASVALLGSDDSEVSAPQIINKSTNQTRGRT